MSRNHHNPSGPQDFGNNSGFAPKVYRHYFAFVKCRAAKDVPSANFIEDSRQLLRIVGSMKAR